MPNLRDAWTVGTGGLSYHSAACSLYHSVGHTRLGLSQEWYVVCCGA
jgi:hypothetical protein